MKKILETTIQFFPINETSMEYLLNHVVLGLVCTYWGKTKRFTFACHVTDPFSFESVTRYAVLPTEIQSQDGAESVMIDDGER